MNKITYQVWHKPTKTIQNVAVIDFNNRYVDTDGIDKPMYNIRFGDIEWRLFTGFKDKNNLEIYTGDIIFISTSFKHFGLHVMISAKDTACFEVVSAAGVTGMFDYKKEKRGIELRGNIYQNPRMIKGARKLLKLYQKL